ncbi:DUF362 domain-containing protein [Candidatus Thorarchaeota archaeon]|nr:MAG: DUF362 domain-containing protein [Candidatus Thorarchaeota archaeon]
MIPLSDGNSEYPVALVKHSGRIGESIQRGFSLIGGLDGLQSPVLIKPNICTIKDGTGSSVTDVRLVEAIAGIIHEYDSSLSVRVVESDSQSKFAKDAFQRFGYSDMVDRMQEEKHDIDLIDLSGQPLVTVKLDGEYFKDLEIHEVLTKPHSLISVAVAKTHYLTFLTGALKNLFGLLPRKDQASYHSHIDSVIADLARYVNTDLSIIDARTAVEGWNGPGTKKVGAFVMGKKPVSVDAVLTRLLGFKPELVSHLIKLASEDLGDVNPEMVGEQLESLRVKLKSPKL